MRYNPKCVDCSVVKTTKNTSFRNKEHTKFSSRCRKCSSLANKKMYHSDIEKHRERCRIKAQMYSDTPMGVLCRVRYEAKERNLSFELTLDYFKQNWRMPCHYCRETLKKVGFDRVDNKLGYTEENTVPCCVTCNLMKRDLALDEFIQRCKKIVDNYNG